MTESQRKKKKKENSKICPSIVKSLISDQKKIIILRQYKNNPSLSKIN